MKDKVKRLLILSIMIISLSFISLADGATWINYNTDREANKDYYDAESITYPAKGIVRVWERRIYSTAGLKSLEKNFGIKGATVSEGRSLDEVNCLTREYRMTNIMALDSSGEIVFNVKDEMFHDGDWEAISPESIIELLYNEVCKKGKP